MRKNRSMLEDLAERYSNDTGLLYFIRQAQGGYQLVLKDEHGGIAITGYLKAGELYTVLNALILSHSLNQEF